MNVICNSKADVNVSQCHLAAYEMNEAVTLAVCLENKHNNVHCTHMRSLALGKLE
jgi:hypothetical protein